MYGNSNWKNKFSTDQRKQPLHPYDKTDASFYPDCLLLLEIWRQCPVDAHMSADLILRSRSLPDSTRHHNSTYWLDPYTLELILLNFRIKRCPNIYPRLLLNRLIHAFFGIKVINKGASLFIEINSPVLIRIIFIKGTLWPIYKTI